MRQEKSGFLATVLATSCCVMPLLLIALGLGGSVLAVVLVRYKAYLMALALVALAYTWWQYARDRTRCAAEICALTGGRWHQGILGLNTGVVAFFFLMTYTPVGSWATVALSGVRQPSLTTRALRQGDNASPAASGAVPVPQRQTEPLALRVEGMT